jgi:ABC-type Fe3+ transport system permease subunit
MILSISDAWQTMSLLEKVYWCFAIPFSLLFVIQLVLTFFGGDIDATEAEGDVDGSIEHDTGIDFQFLTLKNLITFFTIFGWAGIASLDAGLSAFVTVIVSTMAGLIMMTIMASIAYFMGKLTDDGTLKLQNAIGKTASVYLTIPAKRGGLGKVQIKVQGMRTLDALTDEDNALPTGGIVDVVDIINDEILLVKKSGN